MPLAVHATEVKKKILSTTCDISDLELYCRLSLGQRKELESSKHCQILLKTEHQGVMELLQTEDHQASPEVVEQNQERLNSAYRQEDLQGRAESSFATSLARSLLALRTLKEIELGQDWTVYTHHNWQPLESIAKSELEQVLAAQVASLSPTEQSSLEYEIIFYNLKPFSVAILIGLFVFLLSLYSIKAPTWTTHALLVGLLFWTVQIAGIILRVLISGRGPVTNMYETVMWTGAGILSIGLLFSLVKKEIQYLVFACGANLVTLFMMRFATGMLDETIRPLVPVLRDNFWLSTHVTTITLSYATFLLSWVMANAILIGIILNLVRPAQTQKMNDGIRMVIQVGTVLLAAGIILGGIWADYSWGRFWGWDPKETWSLIALIVYMIILHGRYAGWFKGLTFTLFAAGGFLFVLMAWFGVNYILAAGLHSYGFSSGGTFFLLSLFLIQVTIISMAYLLKSRVKSS